MSPLQRLRDVVLIVCLALVAGGGTAFFLFARVLFDRMPTLHEHPRFAAGEIVGPIVATSHVVYGVSGTLVAVLALARQRQRECRSRSNLWMALVGAFLAIAALADRALLFPRIAALRAALGPAGFDGGASSPERSEFGRLHGIENAVQLAIVLAAWGALALAGARPAPRQSL